jgi:multidrug efflux pump subunit AcrA (membrane-fusion protein)
MARSGENAVVLERLGDAHARMRDAYWRQRDIDSVVRIAERALDAAEQADDAALAAIKAIAYDLASFTWPGWGEPGIRLDAAHRAVGLAAARRNLELARRLERPPLPTSRAHWLLGAHLWAAGDLAAAEAELVDAERLADSAGAVPEALLSRAYREHLAAGADPGATLAALARVEGGAELVRQVETAQRVLGG